MASQAVPLPGPGREASRARAHKILSFGRQRTLPVVPEQRDQYRVTVYCDQCAQRWGRGPILAVVEKEPWMVDGHWRLAISRQVPVATSYSGGVIPDRPKRFAIQRRRLQLVPVSVLSASAARLQCPKCAARPRVAVAKLMELAEQAMAAGRHDAYA